MLESCAERKPRMGRICPPMAPVLAALLAAGLAVAASAATTVRVVNPFNGAIINKNVSPPVYLVNGTCHLADEVRISVNGGPEAGALVKGAVWYWTWDLSGVAPSDTVTLTVTPYRAGVAGVAQTITVKVRNFFPGGSLELLTDVFAGQGAVLGDPTQPLLIPVVVRGDAGAGKTIDQVTLSSPTSVNQVYTPTNYEKFNVQTVGSTALPAVFALGNDPMGPGLREQIETIGVRYQSQPGSVTSNIFQRRVIIDPTPPVKKAGISTSFVRQNVFRLTGAFADGSSGIRAVDVEITPPVGPTVVVPAQLEFGSDYNKDVTWSVDYETATEGTFNVVVYAQDNAGNTRREPAVGTFAVTTDRTAPVAAFSSPTPSQFVTGATFAVAATITDASSVTWRLLDNGVVLASGAGSPVAYTWDTTLVPDGVHTLTLEATDAQFNVGSASVTVTVDNAVPAVKFSRPGNGEFVTGTVQITGAVTECNLDSWKIQFDTGGGFNDIPGATGTTTSVSAVWDTSAIASGTVVTLKILATDKAGLSNAAVADTIQVTVVTVGTVSITDPSDGAYVRGTKKIKFTVAVPALDKWELHDLDSSPSKLTDGNASGPFEFDWDTTGKDGRHTIKLFAKNLAGATVDTSVIVTVDNIAPVVTITSPANGAFVRGVVALNAAINDVNPDVFEIQIDGTTLNPPGTVPGSTVAFSLDTTALAEGAHTIKVLATDKAGNTNAAAADAISVTVDNTPPVVVVASPTNGAFIAGPVTASGTVTETNLAKWEWLDNGVVFASGTTLPADAAWNPASDGTHVLKLVVADKAGNVSEATVTVTVDTASPVLTLTVAPVVIVGSDRFVKGVVKVAGTIADANLQSWTLTDTGDAGFVQTGATANFVFDYDTAGKDGTHTFTLNATDKAANPAPPATFTVIADNIAPSVSITAPTNGAVVKGTITLTGTVTDANLSSWQWLDNGSPVPGGSGSGPSASASLNTTLGADGVHVIKLVAVDKAGNVTDNVSVLITVDNTPPAVAIDALPKVQDGADFFVQGVIRLVGSVIDANLLDWRLTDDNDASFVKTGTASGGVSESYTTSGEGAHTFRLKATDKVGFTDEKTVTVIADNVKPTVSLDNPTPNQVVGSRVFVKGTVTVTGNVSDAYLKQWELKAGTSSLASGTASGAISQSWNTTTSIGAVDLVLSATDRIGNANQDSKSVIVDNAGPVVKITSPIPGSTLPPSVAMGSILTLIFRVDHSAGEPSGARAPLAKLLSGTNELNAPSVTVTVQGPSGSFNLSLADALTKPNLVDKLYGSATVSGSADDGYMVIWQLPILRTGYSYGKEYTVRISDAKDVLGNPGTTDQITFRVSLTR